MGILLEKGTEFCGKMCLSDSVSPALPKDLCRLHPSGWRGWTEDVWTLHVLCHLAFQHIHNGKTTDGKPERCVWNNPKFEKYEQCSKFLDVQQNIYIYISPVHQTSAREIDPLRFQIQEGSLGMMQCHHVYMSVESLETILKTWHRRVKEILRKIQWLCGRHLAMMGKAVDKGKATKSDHNNRNQNQNQKHNHNHNRNRNCNNNNHNHLNFCSIKSNPDQSRWKFPLEIKALCLSQKRTNLTL